MTTSNHQDRSSRPAPGPSTPSTRAPPSRSSTPAFSLFRGGFKPIDATLISGDDGVELEGTVAVESIGVDDENIRPHLLSPDFFDVGAQPEIEFRSTDDHRSRRRPDRPRRAHAWPASRSRSRPPAPSAAR